MSCGHVFLFTFFLKHTKHFFFSLHTFLLNLTARPERCHVTDVRGHHEVFYEEKCFNKYYYYTDFLL